MHVSNASRCFLFSTFITLLNNLVFFLRHVLDEISKMPWICFHIDVLSTVLIPFIHIFALLLACRDWLIMSNACMLLVKQCFSH